MLMFLLLLDMRTAGIDQSDPAWWYGGVSSLQFINIFLLSTQSVSQFCRMIDLSQVSPLNFPGRQFGDLPDIIFRADEKNAKKAKYYVDPPGGWRWWIFRTFEPCLGKLNLRMTEFSNASQGG